MGRVKDVLGDIDAPGVDTEIIIRKYGIPDAHSAEAVGQRPREAGPKRIRTAFELRSHFG